MNYHIEGKSQKSTSPQTPCIPGGSKMIQAKYQKQTNLLTKNALPGKATLHKWSGDKDFPRQTKAWSWLDFTCNKP